MSRLLYPCFCLFLTNSAIVSSHAQTILTCNSVSVPPVVRLEGIAERVGDIVLNCSGGSPGANITGNLSIFLSVNITNRIAGNTVTDVVFTVDNGVGPQPVNVAGTLTGPSSLIYNGLSFGLSSSGSATLRIANIRAAANLLTPLAYNSIQAFIGFNSSNLVSLTNTQLPVATPRLGLYGGFSSKIVCGPGGSPLPDDTKSFASFLGSNAVFSSTRVTEGFADAFSQRSAWQSLNADAGTRIVVRYSGFPAGARLFAPDVIAGSDAVQPTAGGDFGAPASGGRYAPGGNGSLLLARVQFTDANGAGGTVVYTPGPAGSGTVSFDSMREITLANGSGMLVYEVVDANPSVQESAQFPTFLGLGASSNGGLITTAADISLAPVSVVVTASTREPIPRFQASTPPADCNLVGDCGARYLPSLFVAQNSLTFTAQASSNFQVDYVQVQNAAGGVMRWTSTVNYLNGSGWLRVSPPDGVNNATIRVDALPGNLSAGAYKAILSIDAGPIAGSRALPITLVITAAPPPPVPVPAVTAAINAAGFDTGALSPGSLATVWGAKFTGKIVSVTFDGIPGRILFANDTQINVLVPMELGIKTSAQLVVTVDGNASPAQKVQLAGFSPGIFKNGILNQDNSVNGPDQRAQPGSIVQIFVTGLSGNGAISARIGDRFIDSPYYAGPAPGLLGVQQVDLILPTDLTGPAVAVSLCGLTSQDQLFCSPAVQVLLTQ